MLFLVPTLVASQNQFNGVQGLLSQASSPNFRNLPSVDDEYNLRNKYSVNTELKSVERKDSLRTYEYFKSTVTVTGGTFTNNFAFGSTAAASGSGGAVFVSYSSLFVENDFYFNGNKANLGGAICSLMSTTIIQDFAKADRANIPFESNKAFKYGGAIYFQGVFEKSEDEKPTYSYKAILTIDGTEKVAVDPGAGDKSAGRKALADGDSPATPTTPVKYVFKLNEAGEIGGGICISISKNVILKKVSFTENKAGLCGGAIASTNAHLSCENCLFYNNQVTNKQVIGENAEKALGMQKSSQGTKGGGAIYFAADQYYLGYKNPDDSNAKPDQSVPQPEVKARKVAGDAGNNEAGQETEVKTNPEATRLLSTEGCCFIGDSSLETSSTVNQPGHEIMLDGQVTWDSYNDNMAFKEGFSVARKGFKDGFTPIINYVNFNTKDIGSKCEGITGTAAATDAKTFSYLNPGDRNGNNEAKKVPSPTLYTYQATPQPEAPYATTSSWTVVELRTLLSPPTIKVPRQTLSATPKPEPEESSSSEEESLSSEDESLSSEDESLSSEDESSSESEGEEVVPGPNKPSGEDIGKSEEGDSNKTAIIAGSVAGVIALIIIIVVIILFIVCRKPKDDSSSELELGEETVAQMPTSTTAPMSNENPLWTTSTLDNSDDPFANNFEEEYHEGVFKVI